MKVNRTTESISVLNDAAIEGFLKAQVSLAKSKLRAFQFRKAEQEKLLLKPKKIKNETR